MLNSTLKIWHYTANLRYNDIVVLLRNMLPLVILSNMQTNEERIKEIQELYSSENPVSFVESVCARPGMYTLDGTLAEVGAFLEGFYSGMGGHSSTEAGREESQLWWDFCAFASEKVYGIKQNGWFDLFKALREKYPEENDAFFRLLELCVEYRHSRSK